MSKPTPKKMAEAAALYTKANDFARGESHVDVTGKTVAISMRLPERQLAILKELARREGLGYQTLMKRWLDDHIREEFAQLNRSSDAIVELKRTFNTAMRQLRSLEQQQKKTG